MFFLCFSSICLFSNNSEKLNLKNFNKSKYKITIKNYEKIYLKGIDGVDKKKQKSKKKSDKNKKKQSIGKMSIVKADNSPSISSEPVSKNGKDVEGFISVKILNSLQLNNEKGNPNKKSIYSKEQMQDKSYEKIKSLKYVLNKISPLNYTSKISAREIKELNKIDSRNNNVFYKKLSHKN